MRTARPGEDAARHTADQNRGAASPQRWTCPMHPDVVRDAPGQCPICGMDLVPQKPGAAPSAYTDHNAMVRDMRRRWLWTNWTVIALGVWLAVSPVTFGYADQRAMLWSDVASGLLLIALAGWAVVPTVRSDFFGRWGACLVGVWLQFAPLVFWAKSPAAYATDTLVGAFVIALTILVPMMPGMAHHMAMMKPGPEVPPGWSYNPSSWAQRAPIIALGFAGWFISRYLAAVQLGYISAAWEPFFGQGTDRVLHSNVSRMWPVSDAGLGAAAYTFETLMGFMGGTARWRTMPWMVLLFGILVVPLGLVHITLVILQPVVVGEWCTMCLAAATVMLVMIPLTLDEVVAMLQFMVQAKREGKPLWRTFWVGDTIRGGTKDDRTPAYGRPVIEFVPAALWGVTAPRTLLLCGAIGLWVMSAPAVLGTGGRAADSDHIAGALVLTTAVIAMAEFARPVRFLNVLLGVWLLVGTWFLSGNTAASKSSDAAAGLAIVLLSLPRGVVRDRYGQWA